MSSAPTRRPTINDVAAEAGVSKGTVSRYLNGKNWVSPSAHASVAAAIAKLGYTPNGTAQNLARETSNCIACVFSEPTLMLSENAIFATELEAISRELTAHGKSTVLMFADGEEQKAQVLRHVKGRHVDGVIMLTATAGDALIPAIVKAGIPIVTAGRLFADQAAEIPYAGIDDAMGSTQAIGHLLDIGRQRIGIVSGPVRTYGSYLRLTAARTALGDQDRADRVVETDRFSVAAGYQQTRELLEKCPDLDAIYVASDVLAIGALDFLKDTGRNVPADVAVVGFDNIATAATLDPPLTTIAALGGAPSPVDLILGLIEGRTVSSVDVPTELVRRAST